MDDCTDFCNRLRSLHVENGNLPSRDHLIAHLQLSETDLLQGREIGNWSELQARSPQCTVCNIIREAVLDASGIAENTIEPERPIGVVLFPEEQSFRLCFPSRLGTQLAFVAKTPGQTSGPDNAKRIQEGRFSAAEILGWLKSCEEDHNCGRDSPVSRTPRPIQHFVEDETSIFRLMDLEQGCVTSAPIDEKYVALSYVWGQLPMFSLRGENIGFLSKPGSLDRIRSQLPRTINDAIDIVRSVKVRYLWVDTLCLIQDDPEDVRLGIHLMNSIYRGSYFTIVAASGGDANAGLPGTHDGRRSGQKIHELRPGLEMAIQHSIDWHLSRSVYNTRGWTLQELVLSQRTLVFTQGQIFFRCQEANWGEGSWASSWGSWLDPDDSNISRIPPLQEDDFLHPFWAYQKLCEDYSRRQIRNDGDALRAIAGLSRPLSAGMGTPMVEGLPAYFLDHFLLYMSSSGRLRRRPQFPSYSWAGWEGRIMWPRENYEWHENGGASWDTSNIIKFFAHNTFIDWSFLLRSGQCTHLTNTNLEKKRLRKFLNDYPNVLNNGLVNEGTDHDSAAYHYFSDCTIVGDAPDWSDMLDNAGGPRPQRYSIKLLDLANSRSELRELRRFITSGFQGINGNDDYMMQLRLLEMQNWRRAREARAGEARGRGIRPLSMPTPWQLEQYSSREFGAEVGVSTALHDQATDTRSLWTGEYLEASLLNADEIPRFPPYPVLQFFTVSFQLQLGEVTHQYKAVSRAAAAMDNPAGEMSSPFDRIQGVPLLANSQRVGSLHPDNVDMLPESGSRIECLALSRCSQPTTGSVLATEKPASQGASPARAPWDLLWVLYVVWNEGIAERRGVGQVFASALRTASDPSPELKLILLG